VDTSCNCVTLRVPVPAPLQGSLRVSYDIALNGAATVVGRTEGDLVLAESNTLMVTLDFAGAPKTGLLDVADIRFHSAQFGEFVVPIFFRASALYGLTVADISARHGVDGVVATAPRWSAGVESGFGQSNLSGPAAGFDAPRAAFTAALFLDRAMSDRWNLRAGLGFSQRGGASRTAGSTAAVRLNYLEIPVVARLRLPMSGAFLPVVYAGPVFAFRLSCQMSVTGAGISSDEPCTDPGTDEPRARDAGVMVGIGGQAPFGPVSVEVGLRHVSGLVSIGVPVDVRNAGWSMTAGVTLPLSQLFGGAAERASRVRSF